MSESKLYRPANGCEGIDFINAYCDRCVYESEKNPCQILSNSFVYDIGDPRYPQEWVYLHGKPTCTKFKQEGR